MSGPTASRFEGFLMTEEGDPYYASGRYWRMLYLSATTITTRPGSRNPLGYW
jgi:hypothetical protein